MNKKQVIDFKNRMLILTFTNAHPNYPIDVLEGRTKNWKWEDYVVYGIWI